MQEIGKYDEIEHRHRFAAWCASTAARASRTKCSFDVEQGGKLVRQAGLRKLAVDWESLPAADKFDASHREWRDLLVNIAPRIIGTGKGRAFTHGIAAKLINVYLKSIFTCGIVDKLSANNRDKLEAIHPPIDRPLLDELASKNVGGLSKRWRKYNAIGWSSFTSEQYENVISDVRDVTNGRLWIIENHWPGFQK
jgi:hypothetical protein